jgi:DNA-binding MarR family transcriptional regulator
VSAALTELERRALIAREDGWYAVTPAGDELVRRVIQARRERLRAALADWSPGEHHELAEVLDRLAHDLATAQPRER